MNCGTGICGTGILPVYQNSSHTRPDATDYKFNTGKMPVPPPTGSGLQANNPNLDITMENRELESLTSAVRLQRSTN